MNLNKEEKEIVKKALEHYSNDRDQFLRTKKFRTEENREKMINEKHKIDKVREKVENE